MEPTSLNVEAGGTATGHYLRRFYFPLTMDSEDAAPLLVATHILGGDPLNSRLGRRIREQEGMTYNTRASAHIVSHGDASRITIQSHYPKSEKEPFLEIVRDEVDRFIKDGVTQQEVEWSKATLLQGVGAALDDDNTLVNLLHRQLERGITIDQMIEHRRDLSKVTDKQVSEVVEHYFSVLFSEVIAD